MALDLGMVIGDTGPTGPTGPTGDTGAVGATGPANSSYGVCSTAANADNKEADAEGFELVNGVVVHVLMNYNNTYSGRVLLDVNHTGGYPIYINNVVTSASNKAAWFAGDVVSFVFDDVNDRWQMLNTTNHNIQYGTCSTSATTGTKVVSAPGFVLHAGSMVAVNFSNANTASGGLFLNVNSTGAKAVYYRGVVTSAENRPAWSAHEVIMFAYNGSYWFMVGTIGSAFYTTHSFDVTAWVDYTYDLESYYPSSLYDLEIFPCDDTDDDMLQAWGAAHIVGSVQSNSVTARANAPAIDVIMGLKVTPKGV